MFFPLPAEILSLVRTITKTKLLQRCQNTATTADIEFKYN